MQQVELIDERKPSGVAELTLPAYLILGMLRLGARSGYEIKRNVELSTRYFSTISQAQIYPLLKELEEAGLVRGKAKAQGKRRRRVFELTADGDQALAAWIEREEPLELEMRDVGLLKLFFADAVDHDSALELVRAIRARSTRILNELRRQSERGAREMGDEGLRFPLLTLGFGLEMHEAWVKHCRALERELGHPRAGAPRAQRTRTRARRRGRPGPRSVS
jgi:PadR family transcriptional regulator AphA